MRGLAMVRRFYDMEDGEPHSARLSSSRRRQIDRLGNRPRKLIAIRVDPCDRRMGYNERGPVSNRLRVTVGRAEVLMTEDVRDLVADAADDPNLTAAEEIRLRYAAIVEFSDDA